MSAKEFSPKYTSLFTVKGIIKHRGIVPVVACIVVGTAMAFGYTARLAIKNPDVTWSRKKNPEPWNEYENKDYKFVKIEPFDTANYVHPRPRF